MRITNKLLIFGFVTVALISGLAFLPVFAQNTAMTDQQVQLIRDNCVSTKNTLNQLHSSDALLRVNRGQIYESMSTKLMEKFNSRVSSNGLSNSNLVLVANNYSTALDTFRADYIIYEKQLTLSMNIDCSKQPIVFYDAVALARNERSQVHADVLKLNQLIDQYQASVSQFGQDYQTAMQGVKQ